MKSSAVLFGGVPTSCWRSRRIRRNQEFPNAQRNQVAGETVWTRDMGMYRFWCAVPKCRMLVPRASFQHESKNRRSSSSAIQ